MLVGKEPGLAECDDGVLATILKTRPERGGNVGVFKVLHINIFPSMLLLSIFSMAAFVNPLRRDFRVPFRNY